MEAMIISKAANFIPQDGGNYDKSKEVKAFDETKTGVKGLVDSVVTKIPRFFIHSPENLKKPSSDQATDISLQIPVIDFEGFESFRQKDVVNEIRKASEGWGFFQVVNHGIPASVLDQMLSAAKKFHDQPQEMKMEWYSRDLKKLVRFFCNGDLLVNKAPANWRDTLSFQFDDGKLNPELFPEICRKEVSDYMKHMIKLSKTISELVSEALGLRSDYLSSIECMETESLTCHYYPACPEPDLTLGATKHADPSFLTILLQDITGGLQVCYQNQWIDVLPMKGTLIINIGDLMQLITNDRFKSVEHRVLVGKVGPRTSVACFFYPSTARRFMPYGAIKDLLCHENPPIYRETHFDEFISYFMSRGLDGSSTLSHFKVRA